MSRPPLKKQVALPLLLAAALGLALSLRHEFRPPLPPDATDQQVMSNTASEWARIFVKIALWMSLALAAVRALNELVFLVFRKRKGYDAPGVMRDLFSLVCYITALTLVLRYSIDLSFTALLPGSALLRLMLGLALQDTLGNLFTGISLHAD